ncbi:hypothetical protein AM588_10011675 [Phytophthora nicotianae]|uniref:PHD-type domain-containing protein n=1 Tax=Phytophthora nicotianae TaxID=4792 RepID=A0A0W8DMH7_PHYNI|nr:hypothetical protein AM588_10011675 [Phytophthora nicotianae]
MADTDDLMQELCGVKVSDIDITQDDAQKLLEQRLVAIERAVLESDTKSVIEAQQALKDDDEVSPVLAMAKLICEVIDDKECERRMITYRDNGEVNFYMMELEKNIVIDAKYRSNDSRFINHSCDPNCVTQKCNWYEKVIAGKHLPEMRALHSYICGGISDWTIHLTTDFTIEASSPVLAKKGPGRPPKKRGRPKANQTTSGTKLIHKRLGLSQAQARCIDELAAFAEGKSKWNKRVPSSSSIDPDRIHRLIDRVKGKQIFVNTDQNDLNEDACFRCGLAGELICCDGCPAAFHLNCTNLAMVPPDGIPWFCSECTNPKHLQKTTETAQTAAIAARSSGRTTPTDYSGRHLRTHAAHQIPSLKKIFHVPAPHTKRRYKKRHKATDRSYHKLEHMPLPVWNESDASETEQ